MVLTSNRSRDLHDALRRRCLYHWIDYPDPVARGGDRAPHRARGRRAHSSSTPPNSSATQGVSTSTSRPGVAETIDWVAALVALGVADLVAADTERPSGQPGRAGQDPR